MLVSLFLTIASTANTSVRHPRSPSQPLGILGYNEAGRDSIRPGAGHPYLPPMSLPLDNV